MASKCSQMGFRKDRYATSTRDSPLTPPLTPSPTTTCLIVTLKMMNPCNLTVIRVQAQEFRLKPLRTPCWADYETQTRLKSTTRQLRVFSDRPTLPANLYCRPNDGFARTGKVAVIRDIAAVTYVKPVPDQSSSMIDPIVALRQRFISYTLER